MMDTIDKILDLRIHSPICLRNTRHCSNNALIGSDKEKYGSSCQKSDSIGRRSAHNCKNRGGSSYLCVQCGVAHCYVRTYTLCCLLRSQSSPYIH